ncbi:MAG: electron transport complex subunit RsxC [Clostridia bacterium]|nr:electron transport complex subunit RsxC [Clostridia bacterium]
MALRRCNCSASEQNSIRERLAVAGIVGMGGAGFPTAVKVSPKTPAECLLINGAECEPYVTCDTRVMVEKTAEFVDGVKLLMTASGVNKGYIAIEDNKSQAIESVKKYIEENEIEGVEVVSLKTRYPQGSEKHIIKSVTGKTVRIGSLPSSVGVIVDNVHTALSTHYAVREGKPLYERVTTVTGGGINQPKNLWIKTGTSYADLIAHCGGEKDNVIKLISGGPMMGFAVSGADYSATKTTGCVLLLTSSEAETPKPGPCINCGRCQSVCPMRLMPMFIDACAQSGDLDGAVKYGLNGCIECGSCSYVCPAKRTLVQSFKLAKKKLRERK